MKKSLLLQVLPVVAALLIYSCNKDDPQMYEPPDRCPWPEITTEGKHTLGFKINGKEWVPCVDLYALAATLRPIDASLTESNGANILSVGGHYFRWSEGDSTHNVYNLSFGPLQTGVMAPNDLSNFTFDFDQSYKGVLENKWSLPESREDFHLEILKLDTVNNIVSGVFSAILVPQNGTDTLYITDGRFDLTYYQ